MNNKIEITYNRPDDKYERAEITVPKTEFEQFVTTLAKGFEAPINPQILKTNKEGIKLYHNVLIKASETDLGYKLNLLNANPTKLIEDSLGRSTNQYMKNQSKVDITYNGKALDKVASIYLK